MNTTPIHVPVTNVPDPEAEAMSKNPALASLTKNNRVKLRLNTIAFEEACNVIGALSVGLGEGVQDDPWLDVKNAENRAALCLALDVYEAQMQPYALAYPDLVSLTLSRCEALVLWRWWMLMGVSPDQAPGFAAVMQELNHLLC
jgi:hypothetical protein